MELSWAVLAFKNFGAIASSPKPQRSYAYGSTINIPYCIVLGTYFTHCSVLDNTEYLMLSLLHFGRS